MTIQMVSKRLRLSALTTVGTFNEIRSQRIHQKRRNRLSITVNHFQQKLVHRFQWFWDFTRSSAPDVLLFCSIKWWKSEQKSQRWGRHSSVSSKHDKVSKRTSYWRFASLLLTLSHFLKLSRRCRFTAFTALLQICKRQEPTQTTSSKPQNLVTVSGSKSAKVKSCFWAAPVDTLFSQQQSTLEMFLIEINLCWLGRQFNLHTELC